MAWDVVLVGRLEFPRGGRAAWERSEVDPRRFDDWPTELRVRPGPPQRVAAMFRTAQKRVARSDVARLRATNEADHLEIAAYLPEDDAVALLLPIATAFRIAGE
jgi:hypothetical protein